MTLLELLKHAQSKAFRHANRAAESLRFVVSERVFPLFAAELLRLIAITQSAASTLQAATIARAKQQWPHGFRFQWTVAVAVLSLSATLFLSCSTSMKRDTFEEAGPASWYGQRFHGRQTANGERFNMHDMTAAHRTLAFGTRVKVQSQATGKTVIVRINDRGPYVGDRVIDLSYAAARQLGIVSRGTDSVTITKLFN